MLRSYGMFVGVVVMGAGLALSACGDREGQTRDEPAEPADNWQPMDDEAALVGTWVDGNSRLRLDRGGRYHWNDGGRDVNGKWSYVRGKIYLSPPGENDQVYEFSFSDQQNTLEMGRKSGRSWRFGRN